MSIVYIFCRRRILCTREKIVIGMAKKTQALLSRFPFFHPRHLAPLYVDINIIFIGGINIMIKLSVEQYWNTNPLKSCIEKDWQNKVQHGQLSPIQVTVHIIFIGGQKSERAISGEINEYRTRCVSLWKLRYLHQAEWILWSIDFHCKPSPKFFRDVVGANHFTGSSLLKMWVCGDHFFWCNLEAIIFWTFW